MAPRPLDSNRRVSLKRRFAFSAIILVGLLVVLEIVVRVFGLGPSRYEPRRFEPGGVMPFVNVPPGVDIYRANLTFSAVYDLAGDSRGYFGPDGRVTYRINEHGMRGPSFETSKPAGTFRILCMGDSFTFGEGMHYDDTYPVRLARLIGEAMSNLRVEALNAGVQGYGTKHSGGAFVHRDQFFEPDLVTLGFFLNDATDDGLTNRQHEDHLESFALSAAGRVSRLWEIGERSWSKWRHQRRYFETTRESFRTSEWTWCKQVLRAMEARSRRQGFRFIVVIFPILHELDGTIRSKSFTK